METLHNNNQEEQPMSQEWDIAMAAARKEKEKKEHLEAAIAEADENGKEPFDYKKFADSYWRKNAFSKELQGDESDKMEEFFREEYYLSFPEATTIEEFAAALEKRDESLGE